MLPVDPATDQQIVNDGSAFRVYVDDLFSQHPELFPDEWVDGYHLHDQRPSRKMPEVSIRRIRLQATETVYRVVPSFVLPYMTGYAADVAKALFLRRFGVPFWGLTYVFGRNDMYWQRIVAQLGRHEVVGTTVKDPDLLPAHLLADEKFTAINGERWFVATPVGADVILGAASSPSAQTDDLTVAYGEFKTEALRLNPDYQPQTVNTDGWYQTRLAWLALFPAIVVIRCFLHAFLRIRERCKSSPRFPQIRHLVWRIYQAKSQSAYYPAFNVFLDFAQVNLRGEALKAVLKFKKKRAELLRALRHPGCHRTRVMLERHRQPMTRCLYMARDFHGHRNTAHLLIRGWVLLHNFLPYCPRAQARSVPSYVSPFHKLNHKLYCHCWLENLLVATSCQHLFSHQIR